MTNKLAMHEEICKKLHQTYEAKNADYGDSFAKVREKYPNAILIRLNDKLSRLERLMGGGEQHVDESVDDTLLDMANYCIMEIVERLAAEIDGRIAEHNANRDILKQPFGSIRYDGERGGE